MIKRGFDFSISLLLISILSPIILIIGFLVFVNLGSPIIFRQDRPGLKGKIFTIYKFRTMTLNQNLGGRPLSDARRLNGFGKFLRSTSLDELPELWNILKGDMSLVGPRPLLVEYLPLYSVAQMRRHDVLPGITGWAQINGRNSISWREKFDLDLWYVTHASLWLDIKILLVTIIKVATRDGISAKDDVTMPAFTGEN